MSEERTREDAKTNSETEKKSRQQDNLTWVWWLGLVAIMALLSLVIGVLCGFAVGYKWTPVILIIVFTLSVSIILYRKYNPVPEKEEWIMEFMGKWITTWEAGLHFLFPFFMSIKAKVFMGDRMITLYMDEKERDGEINALIDFKDASAAVTVRLFFRLFSSHRAVYNIDDVIRATREKIDAGIRAYYGDTLLDDAIKTRIEVTHEKILQLDITEPAIFKAWGVEIIGLSVVDIALPETIKKQRERILEAEKSREVAIINKETAEHTGEATRILREKDGLAAGQEINKVAQESTLEANAAASYLLNKKYFEAIKDNKGVIISSDSAGAPSLGSQFAAGFGLASEHLKDSKKGESK